MRLEDIRVCFRAKTKMIQHVKKNYPGKYKETSLSCPSCWKNVSSQSIRPPHSQTHITSECLAFADVRDVLDLETDEGLVEFWKIVVNRLAEDVE